MTTDPSTPVNKRKYIRLSSAQWGKIRGLWEVGNSSLAQLSEHFGCTTRAIQAHLKKHGVERGSKSAEFAREVKAEIFSTELPDRDLTVQRGRETRESAYLDCVSIQRAMMRYVDEIKDNPDNAFRSASAIKALGIAAAGIERLCTTRLRSLGLDHDDVQEDRLPVLEIRELTAEDLEAIQSGHSSDEWAGDETVVSSVTIPRPHFEDECSNQPDDDDIIFETVNDNEQADKVRIARSASAR